MYNKKVVLIVISRHHYSQYALVLPPPAYLFLPTAPEMNTLAKAQAKFLTLCSTSINNLHIFSIIDKSRRNPYTGSVKYMDGTAPGSFLSDSPKSASHPYISLKKGSFRNFRSLPGFPVPDDFF